MYKIIYARRAGKGVEGAGNGADGQGPGGHRACFPGYPLGGVPVLFGADSARPRHGEVGAKEG